MVTREQVGAFFPAHITFADFLLNLHEITYSQGRSDDEGQYVVWYVGMWRGGPRAAAFEVYSRDAEFPWSKERWDAEVAQAEAYDAASVR